MGVKEKDEGGRARQFVVMGHRGIGVNMLHSPDPRMKFLKENSILSFNAASQFPIHFLEFDIEVTRDDCPVIFHDIFIITQDEEAKPLLRKTEDGRIFPWVVENDDPLCTLKEAFQKVKPSIGFNIELKFDDHILYTEEKLTHILQVILKVVNEHANGRPIIFSSFHPDATLLIRKMQGTFPCKLR